MAPIGTVAGEDKIVVDRNRVGERLRRVARGAGAGVAATLAMSVVQWPGSIAKARRPPPVEITKRFSRMRPGRTSQGIELVSEAVIAHLVFGAAAGAVYGAFAPRARRIVSGVGYAGTIWGVSYLGVLPTLRLMPAAARDDRARQVSNALAHVAFGLVLAGVMSVTEGERSADDAPDHAAGRS
ncbi:MAG: DUF6789 family protein [Acidimicrobiia bacterium]